MSDKTLFNQDLVVNSLTVNNSIDSNASGYVPYTTTISGNAISSNVIRTPEVILVDSTGNDGPLLQVSQNSCALTTPAGAGLIFNNTNGSILLESTDPNVLLVNGIVNAYQYGIVNSGNNIALTCPTPSTLQVGGTCNATQFGITNGANAVALTCPTPSTLLVGGTCNVNGNLGLFNGSNSVAISCAGANIAEVFGTLNVSNGLGLLNGTGGGVLSTNSTGSQLLWNGQVVFTNT